MLTMFTMPKAFHGHFGVIQRNIEPVVLLRFALHLDGSTNLVRPLGVKGGDVKAERARHQVSIHQKCRSLAVVRARVSLL